MTAMANASAWGPARRIEQLFSVCEHIALLEDPKRFAVLYRRDALLDDNVAALFGIQQGNAVLIALAFRSEQFTQAAVEQWLLEKGIQRMGIVGSPGPDLFYG